MGEPKISERALKLSKSTTENNMLKTFGDYGTRGFAVRGKNKKMVDDPFGGEIL